MSAGPVAGAPAPEVTVDRWGQRAMLVARVAASALIIGLTLSGNGLLGSGRASPADHPELVVLTLGAVAVLMVGWAAHGWLGESRPGLPAWPLVGLLLVISVLAGMVSMIPTAAAMIGFTVMAAVSAGADLETGPACAVAAAGIAAIEISALVYRFDTGDAIGGAVAVVVGLLVGRNRQYARVQRTQTAALLAQVQRTRAEEQRAATLDERARIAREIHDLLAHSLGALGIQLEAAHALLTDDHADHERGIQLVGQARRLAASGLAETRQAIEALRTDTPPLPESLAGLIERYRDLHHEEARLVVTGAQRALPADTNLALIRAAHEALTNSAKHAPSAPVTVHLDYGVDQITVTVTDTPAPSGPSTGRYPASVTTTGGYGLAGMRERLLLIGGTLDAGPEGLGWTVRAEVPT